VEVDAITASLLTETLRAWRAAEPPPPVLLELDILRHPTAASPAERAIHLHALIESLVAEELARHRAAEGLPSAPPAPARAALLAAAGSDFRRRNSNLEAWSAIYHRFLAPVTLSVEELATAVALDVRNFRRRVEAGVAQLTDRLRRMEMAEHARQHRLRLGRHLPPPEYTQLFGVAEAQRELVDHLRRDAGPDFLSIEGLGGIGKTALARAVAFALAEQSDYDGLAWISARQTWLNDRGAIETAPNAATSLADIVTRLAMQLGFVELAGLNAADKLDRLAGFLRSTPHLIVIDNLESVSDVELLLPALLPLARPTRFLLTSRQTLSHFPAVARFPMRPLSVEDSRALVESELRRRGRPAALRPEDMAALYAVVGGTPLALKLVAAQMGHWPLPVLLDNLRRARHHAPERLYTFIYQRAWLALSESARQLLVSLLPLPPDGEDVAWLRAMSFLSPEAFDEALNQLLDYSLLETAGPYDAPRYRLHRLTATFLQTEVLAEWNTAGGPTVAHEDAP
jgi:hypothetical protein